MSDTRKHRILVTGPTGNVGRRVVVQLNDAGVHVRALVRDPAFARLPAGVEVVRGDLTKPETVKSALDSVDSVFLVWPFFSAEGAPAVLDLIARHARRVVYLSSMSVRDGQEAQANGFWGEIEHLIEQSGLEWTFLRAGGFAANTLGWADQIRREGVVRWPYGGAARSLIHEADVAAVAVRALTEDGHVGAKHVLTGPEVLSQAEQVRIIADVTGRPVRWEELSPEQARQQLLVAWGDSNFVDAALSHWARLVQEPEPVTNTVEEITGVPACTFQQWVADHAGDFRVPSTEEVAGAYVSAFREGNFGKAVQWFAADVVRIAPLETGGVPVERRGLEAIMENAVRLTAEYEVHSVDIDGPFVAPDQFAVRFAFDETHKPSGERNTATKMSLYTVADGMIVREEVYYYGQPQAAVAGEPS